MNTQAAVKEPSGELKRREFLQLLGTGALGLALSSAGCASQPGATPQAAAMPRGGKKQLRGLFPIGSSPFTE